MGISSEIKTQQVEAAIAFGQMVRRWRERNGWTQYTGGTFAACADPPFAAPSHGTASEIETGKNRHPRTAYFLFLGELNARVATANLKGVRVRKLLDQLKDSRPITDEQGRPWGAAEFWSCHAGLLAPPDWLAGEPDQLAPQLSDDEAAALGDQWKAQIMEIGAVAGMRPLKAVASFVGSIPTAYRVAVEEGLMSSFGPGNVATLWDPATGEWLLPTWIQRWQQELATPSGGG